MNKKKRIFVFIGITIIALILITGIILSLQGKMIDCRGTVESISYNENDKCTYITIKGVYDGPIYTIKVKANTSVKTASGEKMAITDIQVGNEILLDYWGKWKDAETPLTAKWIKFMPENTGE